MSAILVYGESGQGKSTAIENLPYAKTFVICSDEKDLPFKGWKKKYQTIRKEDGKMDIEKSNYYQGKDPKTILNLLQAIEEKRPDIEFVVVDTITHIIIYEFMRRSMEKGYEKFSELAKNVYDIITFIQKMKKNVIVIGHTDIAYDATGQRITKVRTVGEVFA